MKVLVIGCNGMLGHMLSLYLKELGHNVTGFAHNKSPFIPTCTGDIEDKDLIEYLITKNDYDVIINCTVV